MSRRAIFTAVASVALAASVHAASFTAYNDFSLSTTSPTNTTFWGAPGGAGNTGTLINGADGASTGATLALVATNGGTGGTGPTTEYAAGTPAANAFGSHIINANSGSLLIYNGSTGSWSYDVTISGLTPGASYKVITSTDRSSYTDRWTKITIANPDGSATEDTTGGEFHVSGGGITIGVNNTANGYVAQWSNINPGADGAFTLHYASAMVAGDAPGAIDSQFRAYGPTALVLSSSVPEPTALGLLALAGLALGRRRQA